MKRRSASDSRPLDRRFVEYLIELTDGVTGRIVDVLRRAAMQAMTKRSPPCRP
jgi:hypothetical protein